jgi:hypothetical protein
MLLLKLATPRSRAQYRNSESIDDFHTIAVQERCRESFLGVLVGV